MSNSSLVSYTKLSPNNSGKRTHSIDRITPHCVVGQLSVESLGSMFAKPSKEASCNYGIGSDGRVALIVDEDKRSWCSSSKANDQRAVTIECASDMTSPYAFNSTVYNKLIDLCTDICRRNGKTKLLWISDKDKALAYEPKSGEMLLTVHRWFANKSCPGDWLMQRMGSLASKVTERLSGSTVATSAADVADVKPKYYRVRKTWADIDSQLGAYLILENAKKCADEAGYRYGVFDWNGKEIYRKAADKTKVAKFFYPGYKKTNSGDYQSHGAGCVWHDQNGCCLVFDAYWKESPACEELIQYLVDNKLTYIDYAVLSHAHGDHGGGFFEILEDKRFKVGTFVCYDPDSLKLAGDGTENGRSAAGDKAYLKKLIALAEEKGAKIRYVKTGDVITCGDMKFEVSRHQPTAWSEYDTGEAWAYLNDGSINLYERACHVLLCGDGGGKKAAQYFDGDIAVCESEHHGNGDGKSKVEEVKSHGCKLAIECNNEKNGPGSCGWTRYGAGRFRDLGIPVWMLNADIKGVVKGGKMTVSQGNKKMTFDVPFGKIFYRVRKSWANSSSQIGAFTVLAKAKECVDSHPGYKAFGETGKQVYPAITTTTPAASAKPQTDQEKFIAKIGPMAKADMAKNGILACITIAQAILESGWGKSELAVNANNLFGMKKSLSGNTWRGSSWDGKSVYSKQTKEVYASGLATVQADFRAYKSWEMSVNDHSAYLIGAKNGSSLRYKGLQGCMDYKKAAQIIKDGGYATATDYVSKLCKLIEQYDLTKFNTTYKPSAATSGTTAAAAGKPQESSKPKLDGLFRVRKSWADASSQKGAFHVLENAKECADKNPGFCVFDESGKCIYESKAAGVPFLARVDIDDLNIRTGPGTNYERTRYIPKGTYTIVEVKDGKGSTAGWGRLKSGAGWISLDFAVKLK